jgi:hypothetical protein
MARIRTIKPEFFTSEDIVSLSPLARLFYVSMWCEADREGRFAWKPKTLKMRYLPGDDCDVNVLATELTDAGLVELYEVDGKTYAEIPSFKNHQVINNRESESVLPARDADASARVKAEGRKGKEGREGKGKERKEGECEAAPATPSKSSSIGKPDGVAEQTWADWLALRKAKKAPVTETVIDNAKREASKAGMTLEDFLQLWCARGSQGLQAEWIKPSERPNGKAPKVYHDISEMDYTKGVDADGRF